MLPLAPLGLLWLGLGFSLRYAISYYLVLRSRLGSALGTRRHLAELARTIAAPVRATVVMMVSLALMRLFAHEPGFSALMIEVMVGIVVYLLVMWLMRRSWLPVLGLEKP